MRKNKQLNGINAACAEIGAQGILFASRSRIDQNIFAAWRLDQGAVSLSNIDKMHLERIFIKRFLVAVERALRGEKEVKRKNDKQCSACEPKRSAAPGCCGMLAFHSFSSLIGLFFIKTRSKL